MFNQKKIKTLLDKINWLANSFQENDFNTVSALEKSLLKEKVLMFYDEIQNIPTSLTKERTVTEIKKTEEHKVESVPEIREPVIKDAIPVSEQNVIDLSEVMSPRVVVEKPANIIEEKFVVKEEIIVEPEISKEEKFHNREAFNKQLAMPKRDMREIIDLNKSFIFKADLFNQNNDTYNQFLNEVNLTRTEQEAQIVLAKWINKMNWETEENKTFDLVVRAIEKRFLPLIQ